MTELAQRLLGQLLRLCYRRDVTGQGAKVRAAYDDWLAAQRPVRGSWGWVPRTEY